MVEARKRNPDVLLIALPWTWPAWVGADTSSPWTNVTLAVGYIMTWVNGLRSTYNLTLDYIDADWNERGWSPVFVKALRTALDADGHEATQIVCGDDAHVFSCAADVATDTVLASAVYALGSHNPNPSMPPVATGKPLWGSELEVADDGGTDTPSTIANLFLSSNVTGFAFWGLVTSYFEGLFAWDQGIFLAAQPWSGSYQLSGRVWAIAHYTQHVLPGWRMLAGGAGSGFLSSGGSYLTFFDPPSGGLTIVVSKPLKDASAETASFQLSGPAASLTSLQVWRSQMSTGVDADLSKYYLTQAPIAVVGGAFFLSIAPGEVYTLTTNLGGSKGARAPPPPTAPFPTAYADSFDGCATYQEAAYWTDMTGAWECVPSGEPARGQIMQMTVPHKPVTWRPDEQRPLSVIGDINWAAANLTIDMSMAAGETALVAVRASPTGCDRLITGEDLMPGVWLALAADSSTFTVWNAIANVTSSMGVLLSGTLPGAAPIAGSWHTVSISVTAAGIAAASLDGAQIFGGLNVQGRVPDTGFVGIGVESWGQFVRWDNAVVEASE